MHDITNEHGFQGLASAIAEYLTRIDRGETICREEFLAENPDHVAALRQYFADADLIEQFTSGPADGPPAEAAAMPRTFGTYDLVGEIGRGGMGIVFRAREQSTGRLVALKMLLHSVFLSPAEVQRFQNEARTAANLEHSGIIPIYHVGEQQGHLFYTMPLLQGGNLAQRLAAGPLQPQAAAKLLLTIAEAVADAHRHGIIHRDLKPANILLDEHGNPYVADFGLARWLGEDPLGITATGDLLGTPNYMAPEQVNGRPALVGPSADVYAMGAVLYALLVGQPPFQSESVSETLRKICDADPVRPRQIRRSVPRDLETICLKCLEKSPAIRYRSANELSDDLRRFLTGTPLFAQRVSRIERGRRWLVRNPVVGSLVAGIALALVAGFSFSVYYAVQAHQRELQALANLYAADMNLAQQHLQSGAVESALRLLERHRPALGDENGAGWELRHLWHQCHGELRRFDGPRGATYAAAFSPNGRTVAAAGADRIVWIWETAAGEVKHRLEGHTGAVRDLAFAPDGQRLVTVGDDCIGILWDTATGKRIATLAHERSLTTVAFSADGRFIATGGNDEAKVNLWNGATGGLLQSLELGPTESLAFAPDDDRLAIAGGDGFVRVCRLDERESWTVAATIQAHADMIHDVAWAPDGTRLATAGADRSVKLWGADSWSELTAIGPFGESIYAIRFSPDGRRLAAAARNAPIKVWDLDQSKFVAELLGHTALVTSVDYCPVGWRLVSASEDGTVRLWDAAQPTDHDRLEGHLGYVRTVAFSPRGDILASGDIDSTIVLWNPTTCQPVRILRSPGTHINCVAFSPDGSQLAVAEHQGHLRVWNVETGRETLDTYLDPGALAGVDWSPQGDRIAVQSSRGASWVMDASNGRCLAKWPSPAGSNSSIAFNNDGSLLVTAGGDSSLRVWNSATQSFLHELRGHTAPVVNAVFNPQGTIIASSSNDYTIRLWNAATGQLLRTLAGHGGTPFGLAFSPDGTRLASSSTDQTVKLWDVASGLEIHSLIGHTNWARDVAFSPDGQMLASAGYDGTVRIWHAPPATGTVPIFPSPRGKMGLSGLSPSPATTREAAALVRHLAAGISTHEQLASGIAAEPSINDAVRAAAMHQASEFLFHWSPMLAGHRAAERQDWATATDAFERVTTLAPDDVMHWHWLAMASIAAGRHETYERVCEDLLRRYDANARPNDIHAAVWTLLVSSHDENQLERLGPLVGAYARHFPDSPSFPCLYALRTGRIPGEFLESSSLPATFGVNREGWYTLAMAWHKIGNASQARSAYQAGIRHPRSGETLWTREVYGETLRREVERLLAAEPSPQNAPPPRATLDPASPSDPPTAEVPPVSSQSAASK